MSGLNRNLVVGVLATATAFVVFLVILVGGASSGNQDGCATSAAATQPAVSRNAKNSIPSNYLDLYKKAGQQYGIPWNVLAAIGSIESCHGQNMGPSSAGALGPMQFLPGTWKSYGVDGDGDGRRDIRDPADAIPGTANYLRHSGAPGDLRKAIWVYNHSTPYYLHVMAVAKQYAAGNFTVGGNNTDYTGCPAAGPPSAGGGPVAQKVIAFAYAQLGTPYYYGGTCTNPQKTYTSTNCDCSSLTMMAYQHAGITIPRTSDLQYWHGPRVPKGQEQPGDLVFFDYKPGHSGPGHVGIVYDVGKGTMIAAPHTGASVRIQTYRFYPGGAVGFTRPAAHK